MFQLFRLPQDSQALLLHGHHHPGLMLLSVLVAILAATFALQLASLARSAPTAASRRIARLSGAITLAGGIWAMHFIGMLAYELPLPVTYDPLVTLLSVLPAAVASIIALRILSAGRQTLPTITTGGLSVGAGIGMMHYSGMFAMRMDATLYYDPWIFSLSVVVAIVMAMLALWLHYGLRQHLQISAVTALITGGIGMGLAITSMHYTGMAAARLVSTGAINASGDSGDNTLLALGIGFTVVALSLLVTATNGLARYRELHSRALNNERRLRAILDTAVDGIITINGKGLIQSFNHAAERLFGWHESEVIGRNVKCLMPESFAIQHDQYLQTYQDTGQANVIGTGRELVAKRKDGSEFPIRLGVGETVMNGRALFVGFVSDITARKQLEQNLQSAKEQAERAAEAKSAFLSTMSHEIRTPMNAILGFSDALLQSELNPEQHKQISIIQRSSRTLMRLINDILDTAKLERGAIQLESADFSLRALCDDIIEMLSLQAESKGITLRLHYEHNSQRFMGDALRVSQILLNLASNAVKFTQTGGVDIYVQESADRQLNIRVCDTGIGIDPQRLKLVFQPFAQADASMGRRFGGTGLGTTIAIQLAELMGGQISAESSPGEGSTFCVTLPLNPSSGQHTGRESGATVIADHNWLKPVADQQAISSPSFDDELPEPAVIAALRSALQRGELPDELIRSVMRNPDSRKRSQLAQALDNFDFERAIELLDTLNT